MTHQKMLLFRSINSPARHQKLSKKGSISLHLTHQMTHGLTHHLEDKTVYVSLLVAEMAVKANMPLTLHKNSFFRFLPLSTSLIKAFQKRVYKMADLIGMAHSLNLKSITF